MSERDDETATICRETRALKALLRRPLHEVAESPLQALERAKAEGWVIVEDGLPYRRGLRGRLWHPRVITLSEAGKVEAARRGLS